MNIINEVIHVTEMAEPCKDIRLNSKKLPVQILIQIMQIHQDSEKHVNNMAGNSTRTINRFCLDNSVAIKAVVMKTKQPKNDKANTN